MNEIFLYIAIPVFFLVSVNIFKMLPRGLRNLFSYYAALGFLLNLCVSWFILAFTGAAMIVGISNMSASVLFGFYLLLYKSVHRIKKCDSGAKKIKFIPVLKFNEERKDLTGIMRILF